MVLYIEYQVFILPLYLIYVFIQLLVGVYLLYRLKITKFKNIIPLALFFILSSLEGLFPLFMVPLIVIQAYQFLPNITLLFFIQLTFYKDRKSPFKIVLIFVLILKIINFSLSLFIPLSVPLRVSLLNVQLPFYYVYVSIVSTIIAISDGWLAYVSLSYYFSKKAHKLEPWVKSRYFLIGISTLILSLESVLWWFMPISPDGFESPQGFIVGMLLVIIYTTFTLTSMIVWIMPQKLKNFFNRNYQTPPDEGFSDDELLSKIRIELKEDNKE